MTLAAIQRGLYYPELNWAISGANAVVDAATEKFAMIGRLYVDGRSTSAKTLSTGSIQWRSSTGLTFANGSTTFDIGIQDVATGAGPIAQPDGTFDVKTTFTGGAGITANAWQTSTMTSGTKSMTHGDLIAVVWDMTARGGTDAVTITAGNTPLQNIGGSGQMPVCNAYISSAWQTTNTAAASRIPNVIIVFDDGTLGWIDGSMPFSTIGIVETFKDADAADERGMQFQVPWDCKIDALWAYAGITDANSDFTLKLWSSPTSSRSLVTSTSFIAENLGVVAVQGLIVGQLPTEFSLSKNTNYCVSMLATGSSNVRLHSNTVSAAAHRAAYMGGTTLNKATCNGAADFTLEATPLTLYPMGVRISSFDDGTGTGGGSGGGSRSRIQTGM